MKIINPKIVSYIEKKVFPLYLQNDSGHQLIHIKYVINRAIKLSSGLNINPNIIYVAAAYHDLGHHIDRHNHEIISAQLMMQDEKLKSFFDDNQISLIREAIEDHRASSKKIPRSIYGKIISTADRPTSIDDTLFRAHSYSLEHFPDYTYEQSFERAYIHVLRKFGKDGYAKSYIQDPEYDNYLIEIRELLLDKKAFRNRYDKVNLNQ